MRCIAASHGRVQYRFKLLPGWLLTYQIMSASKHHSSLLWTFHLSLCPCICSLRCMMMRGIQSCIHSEYKMGTTWAVPIHTPTQCPPHLRYHTSELPSLHRIVYARRVSESQQPCLLLPGKVKILENYPKNCNCLYTPYMISHKIKTSSW